MTEVELHIVVDTDLVHCIVLVLVVDTAVEHILLELHSLDKVHGKEPDRGKTIHMVKVERARWVELNNR